MPRLFIGLVTHPDSHYPEANSEKGLAHQLTKLLNKQGVQTTFVVEDRNLATNYLPLTMTEVTQSRKALDALQRAWGSYIHDETRSATRDWLSRFTTRVRRLLRRAEPRGVTAAYRLLNIEMAHLSLMTRALESEADFTLVLEDDAHCENVQGLADDLERMLRRPITPYLISLSQSFSFHEMHLTGMVRTTPYVWANGGTEFRTERPVTNTVCAIMYRTDLLQRVLPRWNPNELVPVIPVDWRLNQWLMALYSEGELPEGECRIVQPGPIVQQSLHER
jgi:hypothetical protein